LVIRCDVSFVVSCPQLSRAHIKSGYDVLTEVQEELAKGDGARRAHLLALSNKFYSIVPHDFGLSPPTILDSVEEIKKKIEMIDTLLEVETATKLLKSGGAEASAAAAAAGQSMDPIDLHYRQLKTEMKPLERDDSEFKLIQTYITNTHAKTHANYTLDLLDCFDIQREGEAERYKPFADNSNRMLLWHGSRTTNYVGILSQGLRIAPPEAPVTGQSSRARHGELARLRLLSSDSFLFVRLSFSF
jgi:poly [ADP-ribose] polymerase